MQEEQSKSGAPIGEISQGPTRLERVLSKNEKLLLPAFLIITLLISSVILFKGVFQNRNLIAASKLLETSEISSYQTLADINSNSVTSQTALIALANLQWDNNEKETSIASLRQFISDAPKHPLVPLAKSNLAGKLKQMGEIEKAYKIVTQLEYSNDITYSPIAQLQQAEIHFIKDEYEKGSAILTELLNFSRKDLGDLKPLAKTYHRSLIAQEVAILNETTQQSPSKIEHN